MATLNVTREEYSRIQRLIGKCTQGYMRFDESSYISGMRSIVGAEVVTRLLAYGNITLKVYPTDRHLPVHATDPDRIRRIELGAGNSI